MRPRCSLVILLQNTLPQEMRAPQDWGGARNVVVSHMTSRRSVYTAPPARHMYLLYYSIVRKILPEKNISQKSTNYVVQELTVVNMRLQASA